MTSSPMRNSFTAIKRTERQSVSPQILSQKANVGASPTLNEEQEGQQRQGNLRAKLELLLKHNSQLLNENAQLSELVNELRSQVEVRTRREETEFSKMNQEMGSVMVELKGQQQAHQGQLERLLKEISKLHDQCHQLQVDKENAIRRLQESHERDLVQQITKVKNSQYQGVSLMELQISKLKQTIEMKDFEYDSLTTQTKGEIEQLKNQNALLESEIEHQRKLKDLQLNEISRRSKDDMRAALKHLQLEKNVELRQYENRILKLKKDVASKELELQQQAKKTTGQNEEIYLELSSMKKEKQYLLEEIQTLAQSTQQKIVRQKERTAQLSAMEKQNLENMFSNEKESMRGEREKLLQLCVDKSEEIKRLYISLNKFKASADEEREQLKSLISGLRSKLKEAERSSMEQNELLKIKMAQLHRADVESLQGFYEREVKGLHEQLALLKERSVVDREKIYEALQQNDELRKNFEIQISKQKAKIQDMKVKFAAARLQFKEQITSLGTKMELTSQSLVRETEQKQRGAEFFENEKRKFYQMIEAKDKEIQNMHDTTVRLKQLNEQEITHLKSQINMLRDSLLAKEEEIKEAKAALEEDFKRRSMKLIEESKAHPDEHLQREYNETKAKLAESEKDNFSKDKQIGYLKREVRSLQQELGLKAGFIETMQMQSCAAIEDQKQKMRVMMGKSQVAMKDYYEMKIASCIADNKTLKEQLGQKQTDMRKLVDKYHHLQRRLKDLLEAQDTLTTFEEKIVNLGLDQNLVKNMAELFTPKE